MSDNISLNSVPVSVLLETFKNEMKKLDALVNKLDFETQKIKQTWQGTASDETLEKIDKLKIVFDGIKTSNERYVKFVDYVVDKYKELDESERKFVETQRGAFDTSFYGDIQN